MNNEEAIQTAVDILRGDANDLATLGHEPVWNELPHRAKVAIQREIQRIRDAAQKLTELPIPEEIDPADEPDEYGNTEREPFTFCSFPDCGCDGARLCQAKSGPSGAACAINIERGSL